MRILGQEGGQGTGLGWLCLYPGAASFASLFTIPHHCVQTGAYVVFLMLLHKLRFRQIKDLPVLKCLAAGGCLETDRSTVAGTRASHGLRMTSRGTYVHRLPHM